MKWQVSIPQSEFCAFTLSAVSVGPGPFPVSIPQSEFCAFTLLLLALVLVMAWSFNSSVGILCVHASSYWLDTACRVEFQFLSRNSVRSRLSSMSKSPRPTSSFNSSVGILCVHAQLDRRTPPRRGAFQFLSRNSVRSRRVSKIMSMSGAMVSIPQSEFCAFTLRLRIASRGDYPCFNSSVGILCVHAVSARSHARHCSWFQFLSRNSVRSRQISLERRCRLRKVSIPQSEFCAFTPRSTGMIRALPKVSIPQSEFCAFTLSIRVLSLVWSACFNSSVGILCVHAFIG